MPRLKLVWSQSSCPSDDRPRSVLLIAVLCIFLGGVVVGAGGRDLAQAPRPVRAVFASLLSTGAVLFVVGVALLLIRKGKASGLARLALASPPDASAVSKPKRHFGQEERR
ncbi:MAG: hypothetical protein ABI968_12710 [Acidobacteriota bacterium]